MFTGTPTQDSFLLSDQNSCNLLAKKKKFCLGAVILSCLVSELQKPSSSGFEPRTVFQFYSPVAVIVLSKQGTFVFVPFFYRV
jgi:hypothetical protein